MKRQNILRIANETVALAFIAIVFLLIEKTPDASAATVSDPTNIPLMFSLEVGSDFEMNQREFELDDQDETLNSMKVNANIGYSISDQLEIYAKFGLMQTETSEDEQSDWSLGYGAGLKGCFAEFQDGNIRTGFDAQVYYSELEYSYLDRPGRYIYEEDIAWLEYQLSGVISWRAYLPLTLYTGLQVSGVDVEFDTRKDFWATEGVIGDSIDGRAKQMLAILWGVDYRIAETVDVFAEIRALSEISGAFGFQLSF